MTNKFELIVADITEKLRAAGIPVVIRWPEQLQNVGSRYPMAIIKEGYIDYVLTSGQRYEYQVTFSITLVSDAIRERMKYMNNLQVAVFNALFATATLGGLVANCNPVRVQMGDLIGGADISGYAGFTEAATFRTIEIQCLVFDTRL